MAKKYTKEQEREIEYLKSNYDMLVKTKEEAKLRGTEQSVQRIELAIQDAVEQLKKIDPNLINELKLNVSEEVLDLYEIKDDMESLVSKMGLEEVSLNTIKDTKKSLVSKMMEEETVKERYEFNDIDSNIQYDVIELPSKGQCYKDKYSRVPVSYLTAYDENLITSPNLYKDGMVIDYLLKHKVMNKEINLSELCVGDVDAIILFLRATSYGPEYPIIVRDPESGEEIESVVDLSSLKIKEFVLEGDENGWFEYILPLSKDVIKFRYLTRKDLRILDRLSSMEDYGIKSAKVRQMKKDLSDMIRKDDVLLGKEKQIYIDNLNKLDEWCNKLNEKEKIPYNKVITNRLELSIMSVNGETDREYISKYVCQMSARDALMLRRYMLENEPGVDFEIEVERPESLGGGSFKTFLEWNDSVFLNIA